MVRRVFALAAAVCALAASGVKAEPAAEFSNPTPIDYSKPFLFDGAQPRQPPPRASTRSVEVTLPVEVILAAEPAKPEDVKPSRARPAASPPASGK
jgi:hypothetical protein